MSTSALIVDATSPGTLEAAVTVQSEADGEILYKNERTLIVRRRIGPDRSMIEKNVFGAGGQELLKHEAAILERLSKLEGVPRLATDLAGSASLLFEDDFGQSLAQFLLCNKLSLDRILTLSIELTRVLSGVHRAGIIHKDINPANVLIVGSEERVVLIDFGISIRFAEELTPFTHQRHIAGTLAYMAPEQTGRTGRAVDQRSDLYALGATLYELAAGRKPFETEDLLDLIRDQLATTPTPPCEVEPKVPTLLSDLIMRLLNKDADRRYQSAEGLGHDLERLRAALRRGEVPAFELGDCDFPLRLTPPTKLIGRNAEIDTMAEAVDRAMRGDTRAVLVAGTPGVGKSVLINELQPMITACHGWFVSGKFDQYHYQEASSAVSQAFRALGRLILAEPEDKLAVYRERIRQGLGVNLGFGPSLLPEFALVLGEMPKVKIDDPLEAETRLVQACLDMLKAVVRPERPVVMVLDDLQWAPDLSLRFVDALMTAETPIQGLLLVGAYRSNEIDAAHCLGVMLTRWENLGVTPPIMSMRNLPPAETSSLVGEMLRLSAERAGQLGRVMSERTGGNPYDTVDLINALRHDGLLSARSGSWHWDNSEIRRYVGDCDVVGLLNKRIASLPQASIDIMETIATLGGEVTVNLLALATERRVRDLHQQLAPALEDGLLVTDNAPDRTIRFRHDRVQQATHERMAGRVQGPTHLLLARRLSANAAYAPMASQQYLFAVGELQDVDERRAVAKLFRKTAARNRVSSYALSERFATAALQLLHRMETPEDVQNIFALMIDRHAALYGLSRLDEADVAYDQLALCCTVPQTIVDAACVQIASLSSRNRHKDAMKLGLDLLEQLGLKAPDDLKTVIGMHLFKLAAWLDSKDRAADVSRAELTDPLLLSIAKLLSKTQVAGFFCSTKVASWLTMEGHRMWIENGPCPALQATICWCPLILLAGIQDYKGAHTLARHLVNVAEARGYRAAVGVARFQYPLMALHWFEPVELSLAQYQQARESLVQAGELQYATFTYADWPTVFEWAPILSTSAELAEGGFAMARRTNDKNFMTSHAPSRQLMKALRGEIPGPSEDGSASAHPPGSFNDGLFDEAAHLVEIGERTLPSAHFHIERAVSAAIFNDISSLIQHAGKAIDAIHRVPGYYITVWIHLLQGLALGERARIADDEQKPVLLKQMDDCVSWMRKRAADSPVNYQHLNLWLQAERTWAAGDMWQAAQAFDQALAEAQQHQRPWHRALATERAGLFYLSQGMNHMARPLLTEACGAYAAWGARGKVKQMQAEYPFVQGKSSARRLESIGCSTMISSTTFSSDLVDVASVLRASQALSSETSLERLSARVGQVLSGMTGAATVRLAVRTDEGEGWVVSRCSADSDQMLNLSEAISEKLLPLAPLHYVERTREPLLLNEATRDSRFTNDPYFADVEHSSMLLVPVLSHNQLRALLVLETRLARGAFADDRLEMVTMIAGQLAVSVDNALLYASLERKVAERTVALEEATRRLEQLSITDALTGLANRRGFDEALKSEWSRARRAKTAVGFAIMDIDVFKLYNDRYGHQAGDACLKLVAEAMKTVLREGNDLVARYGGEEFVLLLPNTDLAGVLAVAERVRASVYAKQEPHENSIHGVVTVSVGAVSFVPSNEATAEHYIELADAALYDAKRNGRNRVQAGGVSPVV